MSHLDLFFKIVRFLSPKNKLFYLIISNGLKKFFRGLAAAPADFKNYIIDIYLDLCPDTTRELTKWEKQFGIVSKTKDDSERRSNISSYWSATGGQSAGYIQDQLCRAGFCVKVHENNPPVNPSLLLSGTAVMVAKGFNAFAGYETAYAGQSGGDYLVNGGQTATKPAYYGCGQEDLFCGGENAAAGFFEGYVNLEKIYPLPDDPDTWGAFFFIGGDATRDSNNELTSIDNVEIPNERKKEFEALIYKLKPAQTWAGYFITFT